MRVSTLLAALPLASAGSLGQRSEPAPLVVPRGVNAERLIADDYIVKFREGSALAAIQEAVKLIPGHNGEIFQNVFKGFSGKMDSRLVNLFRSHPDVEYIEQNAIMTSVATQSNAPWGLARISHVNTGSSQYVYDDSAGEGTCSYIIDSGIYAQHSDFGGRAKEIQSYIGGGGDTCGHGTHVAGTIGGTTYGVAKKTQLLALKVLAYNSGTGLCQGPNDGTIKALDYISKDVKSRNCPNGAVVNMSLGGPKSSAVNNAVAALVRQGIFVAVAAGNGVGQQHIPEDAGNTSPASEPSACCVGAHDINDKIAYFSNYGSLVDIHGPGVDITSAKVGGGSTNMSGTSMATPHIAGLGAYFLGQGRSANGMCDYLQSIALKNRISGVHSGTKNLLAQNDKSQ